ncbi:MAG: hypothetical protein ACREJ2_05315 [Planctomycetota bacterium]
MSQPVPPNIPIDFAGATLYGWQPHADRHLQLTLTLAPAVDPAQKPLELWFLDIHWFGCFLRFLDSYIDATPGDRPGEQLCTAHIDGLVYNQKQFSLPRDLFLILRLEGAGFKFNCGDFRLVDPATETFRSVGDPEFRSKGECG